MVGVSNSLIFSFSLVSLQPVKMTSHIASCSVMPAILDSFAAIFTASANDLSSWHACWAMEKKFLLEYASEDRQAGHAVAHNRGGGLDATVELETQFSVKTVKQVGLLHV